MALHAALAATDLDALVRDGDLSVREIARALREQDRSPTDFMVDIVLVLPPGLRPRPPLSEHDIAGTDSTSSIAR